MKSIALILLSVCMLVESAFAQPAQPAESSPRPLSLEQARQIAAAAETEARRNGWAMAIAIVDTGGDLVLLQRMDGTQIASVDVAIDKAKSANGYRRPTKAFEDALGAGRIAVLSLRGAIPVEGGVPIVSGGRMVGAIGISGASSQQDGQVAAAGVGALR